MQNPARTPRKSRFVAFAAISIDGKISLTKKTLPRWTSKEDQRFFKKALVGFDAYVVGRNTYVAAAKSLRERNTFVFTRSAVRTRRAGTVTFVNPKAADLTKLFGSYKNIAVLGGAGVYGAMLEQKMIDEFYITVEPLLFGRGQGLVAQITHTVRFHLLSVRRLNTMGTLLLHYVV